jgi:hypothetical protein
VADMRKLFGDAVTLTLGESGQAEALLIVFVGFIALALLFVMVAGAGMTALTPGF